MAGVRPPRRVRLAVVIALTVLTSLAWTASIRLFADDTQATPVSKADWLAVVSTSGEVRLSHQGTLVTTLSPGLLSETGEARNTRAADDVSGVITAPNGTKVACEMTRSRIDNGLRVAWTLTPQRDVTLSSLHVAMEFPSASLAGRQFQADAESTTVPVDFGGKNVLLSRAVQSLRVSLADSTNLDFRFNSPARLVVQDNRPWPLSVVFTMSPPGGPAWPARQSAQLSLDLTLRGGLPVQTESPVTLVEGPDWIPLTLELDIEPGSALDFSKLRPADAPAGSHGRVIARPDGHFAFEKSPRTPQRFYGVNFCFSAHYITHEESDRIALRLARLGYNTLRIHHYESALIVRGADSVTLDPNRLDQLDYLVAALKKQGIYVTTDLYVSRPVLASEIWPGAEGRVAMNDFKMAVPVNEKAWENWKTFASNLLTHVNPYTGLSWAQDPAVAWICMINEGNLGNYIHRLDPRLVPDWTAAWNSWLRRNYASSDALRNAWAADPDGDPAAGTVPLFSGPYLKDDDSPRTRDLYVFLAETERDAFRRMKTFLRNEVGTRALLTSSNGWTSRLSTAGARLDYDFVDDHFYVDHPDFLEREWSLPSRQVNTSYVAGGTRWSPGSSEAHSHAFVRLWDKPFTISEFNYPYPGRFRSQGGILAGSLAALQDWSAMWRFAYSHNRRNLFDPQGASYFDLAADPLNQASDRAALCLYLRGDMRSARHSIAIATTPKELLELRRHNLRAAPDWNALALVTRVGTLVVQRPGKVPADVLLPLGWASPKSAWSGGKVLDADPFAPETGNAVLDLFRQRGWLKGSRTDLKGNVFQSESGEFTIDAPRNIMVLDTPMTAGGFAPEGQTIDTSWATIRILKTDATVWISSLDDHPITSSRRLLVTHLTDLQNTGARFAEPSLTTLLDWGRVPHLVRAGSAEISIKLKGAAKAKVWTLSTGGKRLSPVETIPTSRDRLIIPLDVKGPEGARMLYEVAVE